MKRFDETHTENEKERKEEERDRGHEVRNRNGAIKSGRLTNRVKFPSVSIDDVVSSNNYGVHATYYIILLDSRRTTTFT